MKRFLCATALIFSTQAKAYFLFNIPVVSLAQVNAESPITEMHELCDKETIGASIGMGAGTSFGWAWKNCMRVAYRPDAVYGQKFLVIMSESDAKTLFQKRASYKDQWNPYDGIPNPIQVVAVPDSEYRLSDGPIPYPPDGYLTETDPEIGKKMLYCQASAAICGTGGLLLWEASGLFKAASFLRMCGGERGVKGACGQFRDAWKKEREALQQMEDWNSAHGVSRTPFDKWYREVFGTIGRPSGGTGAGENSGPPAPPATSGFPEGGTLTEHCYSSVVTVDHGPLGEKTEYPETNCYYF